METKFISLDCSEFKFDSESMSTFSGYASVFGGVDTYGDTIMPGAYKSVVGEDGAWVKMYFNHGWLRHELPIGKMFVKEDRRGLYVEKAEFTKGLSMAADVRQAMLHETITGLSIGYKLLPEDFVKRSDGGRDIHRISQLKEVSVVDYPADSAAQVIDVKQDITEASSLKDIERVLRDAGRFSRADATALVSRVKALCHGERAAEDSTKAIADAIRAATSKLIVR